MSDLIRLASSQARDIILDSLGRLVSLKKLPAEPIPDFIVEIPADKTHGDFAANAAMVSARSFRLAPRKIAELICEEAVLDGTFFEKMEIAGPGFINFFLSREWFSSAVDTVIKESENYGRTDTGNGKKAIVEFVSANPTGPMHIGNARGGAIGDGLAEILDWAGYSVEREFYVNDAGNQIEKFGKSLDLRYMQICSQDGLKVLAECNNETGAISEAIYNNADTFPMPEDVYLGMDIIAHAHNYFTEYGGGLAEMPEEERRKRLVGYALPKNIAGLEEDLNKYRITYDTWFKESDLHKDGSVEKIVDMLTASGYTYELDGAIWFKSSELGDEKDRVLVRANGIPTYFVPDIAYHYNKLVTRGFDKAIDIFGADHHGYIPRMKAALTALGVDPDRLDIVIMQMVNLVKDGEKYKLSKRSGKAITLSTLLDEIPIDAARFFFNMREPGSTIDFDLGLAVKEDSQNPVYYCQYANARICSILRKMKEEGIEPRDCTEEELMLLNAPEERELIRHLSALTDEIITAAKDYDPARITRYAVTLATLFHKFYNACRVGVDDEKLRAARLYLCCRVKDVMGIILTEFKITVPESM